MTSEAILPRRPPKWPLKAKFTWKTKEVEVTEFNSEVRCDLRGCLEAAMASEAIKMAVSAHVLGGQILNHNCNFEGLIVPIFFS